MYGQLLPGFLALRLFLGYYLFVFDGIGHVSEVFPFP